MVKPVGIQRPCSSWWLHQATPLRPHNSVKNVTCRSRSIREPVTRRVAHPAKIPAMWRTIQPAIHSSSENSSSRAMGSRFLVGGWWRKGGMEGHSRGVRLPRMVCRGACIRTAGTIQDRYASVLAAIWSQYWVESIEGFALIRQEVFALRCRIHRSGENLAPGSDRLALYGQGPGGVRLLPARRGRDVDPPRHEILVRR